MLNLDSVVSKLQFNLLKKTSVKAELIVFGEYLVVCILILKN